jgi:hypothetical protein
MTWSTRTDLFTPLTTGSSGSYMARANDGVLFGERLFECSRWSGWTDGPDGIYESESSSMRPARAVLFLHHPSALVIFTINPLPQHWNIFYFLLTFKFILTVYVCIYIGGSSVLTVHVRIKTAFHVLSTHLSLFLYPPPATKANRKLKL